MPPVRSKKAGNTSESKKAGNTNESKKAGITKNRARTSNKQKKRKPETFNRFIYKVFKQVNPDLSISTKSMTIMNNLINDMFERLAAEASFLVKVNKRRTLSSREIQSAVLLIMRGELAKHAISEGIKALTMYNSSS